MCVSYPGKALTGNTLSLKTLPFHGHHRTNQSRKLLIKPAMILKSLFKFNDIQTCRWIHARAHRDLLSPHAVTGLAAALTRRLAIGSLACQSYISPPTHQQTGPEINDHKRFTKMIT